MGIETILAVSEADKNSLPAMMADKIIVIGPASATSSYLKIANIIDAAMTAKVDAIHPGYGFLSESAEFASACKENNLIFIGPSITVLNSVGDKLQARSIAIKAGLPVVPGGDAADSNSSLEVASSVGFPLLVKAVGGGGGRGMKLVTREEDLFSSIELAKAEADAAFADARVYLERYITNGRHVEVQIVGDGKNYIHLGDRDCSIQRRYQKLFEGRRWCSWWYC
jgi:acetyl-CoA carboxylase biotin carboxylase subunit